MSLLDYHYLSPRGLQKLKEYRYVSGLSGWLDRVVMTPFWDWVVTLLPINLAPNLITTISLVHALFAYLLFFYYCPTLSESAPSWVYALVALCIFIYQTLDAVDGKQARRTGTGSPLGQLFDHGCDAITAFLMGIFVAATVQTGNTPWAMAVLLMHTIPFFLVNWEESVTSIMRFGIVGVTEGQFLVIGIELLTAYFGPAFWNNDLTFVANYVGYKVTPFMIAVVFGTLGVVFQFYTTMHHVNAYFAIHPSAPNRACSQRAFIQFWVCTLFGGVWALAPTSIMSTHGRAILCILGSLTSYQVSRLIVCHVTDEPFPAFFNVAIPLPFVVINSFSTYFNQTNTTWISEANLIYAYGIYIFVLYTHFAVVTINQITTFLGIKCFVITPKKKE